MRKKLPFVSKHTYEQRDTMIGVGYLRKTCRACGKYRPVLGSKNLDIGERHRAFICKECVENNAWPIK